MNNIYQRVVNWNSKRYDRVYNHQLTLNLLREEHKEWLDSNTDVDHLDALCDIIYVAFGALWKLDIDQETMDAAFESAFENVFECTDMLLQNYEPHPAYLIATVLDVLEYEDDYPIADGLAMIAVLAQTEVYGMGLTPEQCNQALLIVCDSNDSKSIMKVAADVKANAGNKGPYFVPPEPRLEKLLAERKSNG